MKRFNLAKGIFGVLFACALILGCLGAVKANAATPTATYDAAKEVITVTTEAEAIYYAVGKDGSGVELAPAKYTKATVSGGSVTISVNTKKTGLGLAENKAVYFYVAEGVPTAATGEKTVKIATPALTVDATKIKKVVVNLDYAKAASGESLGVGIGSIKVTDNDKNDTTYTGDTLNALVEAGKVLFSIDNGKTWTVVDDDTFGTDDLYAYMKQGKVKLQFKVLGAATERPSKAAKVGVKKEGKAPKAPKVDISKLTIAIKNGFDFFISTEETTPGLDGAHTVLPYNKEGKAPASIVDTWDFNPVKFDKKDTTGTTAKVFTATKYKALSIKDLADEYGVGREKCYIYIRKSAAAGKPASAWSTALVLDAMAAAPDYADEVIVSTTGASITAVLPTVTSGSAFEYIVVKKADYEGNKIDWTTAKWTKLTAKVKFDTAKTKSKYGVIGTDGKTGKAEANQLASGSYILIRVTGVKKSGVLPSHILVTEYSESGTTKTWKVIDREE